MFTQFSAPRRPGRGQIAGALISMTAHAAIVVAAVGGELFDPGATGVDDTPSGASDGRGEGMHWVGTGGGGTGRGVAPRPGVRPPTAYVIPGRSPAREGAPGPHAPGRRAPRAAPSPDATLPPSSPRTPQHVELPRALPALPTLPAPPEVEVTLLVAGVLSSAPDLDRRASRPEDFAPLPANELAGALLARADVRTADGPRPLAHVDELPIALVGNPRPAYPAMLARARVGGRVVVEFTIDSVGIVAPGSFRVVESTDARFTQAVRAVLPRLRFLPAQLDRHAVGVTVRQPFVFTVRPGA